MLLSYHSRRKRTPQLAQTCIAMLPAEFLNNFKPTVDKKMQILRIASHFPRIFGYSRQGEAIPAELPNNSKSAVEETNMETLRIESLFARKSITKVKPKVGIVMNCMDKYIAINSIDSRSFHNRMAGLAIYFPEDDIHCNVRISILAEYQN